MFQMDFRMTVESCKHHCLFRRQYPCLCPLMSSLLRAGDPFIEIKSLFNLKYTLAGYQCQRAGTQPRSRGVTLEVGICLLLE